MLTLVRNCYRYRELLFSLSESYLKARYKQTILGIGWAVMPPLALLFAVVFALPHLANIPASVEPYAAFVFVGLLFWTFFANALAFAIPNLVQNSTLLRKVYFPRELLIIAAIVPSMVDFGIGFLILLILLWYFGIAAGGSLLLIPVLFIVECFLVLGISFIGSIANVAFRDISKFLPLSLQVLFFVTPVIYPILHTSSLLFVLNPLAGIIETARAYLLSSSPLPLTVTAEACVASLVICWVGFICFKKGEQFIADIA